MRRLEPQGFAHGGEPHADRGGSADRAATGARLDRRRPALRPGTGPVLHLVELSFSRLDEERPRPTARPYVGVARACRAPQRARGARAVPQLGATVGPCAADPRGGDLSDSAPLRRAIAALRAGRPVRIEGAQPAVVVAVA